MNSASPIPLARLALFLVTILCAVAAIATPAQAYHRVTYYPITGDLGYDGQTFADSYFRWDTVSTAQSTFAGYEHDLTIETELFTRCTSFTDLPEGYDDCPSVGKFEPDQGESTFSFGSFHFNGIQDYQYYMGGWLLGGGSSMDGRFFLKGQETHYRTACPFGPNHWWCRAATETTPFRLAEGRFYLAGGYHYYQWNLSD